MLLESLLGSDLDMSRTRSGHLLKLLLKADQVIASSVVATRTDPHPARPFLPADWLLANVDVGIAQSALGDRIRSGVADKETSA